MARYTVYPTTADSPLARKWILRALLLSILLHAGFFLFAYWKKIENFSFTDGERLSPPAFVVKQVTIDPKTLEMPEETRVKLPSSAPKPEELIVPAEKPDVKEIVLKPSLTEVSTPLLQEKPKSEAINLTDIIKSNEVSAGSADKELGAIASDILKSSVPAPRQPIIKLRPGVKGGDGSDAWEGIPGRKSLDELLQNAGPLPAGGVRGAMPGGALFDYDKVDLRPQALDELKKLGELIQRYPNATFVIEGHTDSIGGRDYNIPLSLRRAESVKAWLVAEFKVDPSRIETIGFGPDKLLVPADKSIDEQQPNRRVEIVIKTNKK
jgi:OmpA-OmpF porin, OOP family